MSVFPLQQVNTLTLHPHSLEGIGNPLASQGAGITTAASAVYFGANRAVGIPFCLSAPFQVQMVFWYNGATVGTNHVDVGVYASFGGARIFSARSDNGADILSAGANGLQTYTLSAPVTLAPGTYAMALAMDGITDTLFRVQLGSTALGSVTGYIQPATSYPLPAILNAAGVVSDYIPLFGFTSRSFV